MRTLWWSAAALVLCVACGSNKQGGAGTAGSGGAAGADASSAGAGGTGGGGGASGDTGTDASVELPASCAHGGPGMTNCGAGSESCCTSPMIAQGSYHRTYDTTDAGGTASTADAGASAGDPATVSAFRLDKYDVTVGRFRQFVTAVLPGDGGAGWRPQAGSGKHAHLNGGLGLVDVGVAADAGTSYESGWLSANDVGIAPTDANLATCGAFSTWTPAAGTHENLPINCVTWWEAVAFCIWDGGFLPSEAEWEYAAAGGGQQRAYPWGSADPGTANRYAIYDCNYPDGSTSCTDVSNIGAVGTATLGVGLWGQLDLAGNLWQWNLDRFGAYVSPCVDCARLSGTSSLLLRGGSFRDDGSNLAPPYRNGNDPGIRNDFIGFRCARQP